MAWQAVVAQLLPAATQQQNNTNAHAYVVPQGYSQTPLYVTVIAVTLVIGVVGYALFNKK